MVRPQSNETILHNATSIRDISPASHVGSSEGKEVATSFDNRVVADNSPGINDDRSSLAPSVMQNVYAPNLPVKASIGLKEKPLRRNVQK